MKIASALVLSLALTNCKGKATEESVSMGVSADQIGQDLYPDYKALGTISPEEPKLKELKVAIYFFLEQQAGTADLGPVSPSENSQHARTAFKNMFTFFTQYFDKTETIVADGRAVERPDQVGQATGGRFPSEIQLQGQTGRLNPRDTSTADHVRWTIALRIGPAEDLARSFGQALATHDLVFINGHLMAASIGAGMRSVVARYKNMNVRVDQSTGDPFMDATYVPAMREFHQLARAKPAALQKPKLLMFNSCFSESLENMVFNAAHQAAQGQRDIGLSVVGQRGKSNFRAFHTQMGQFFNALRRGDNWRGLVSAFQVSEKDRRLANLAGDFIPVLRTATLGYQERALSR